MSFRERRLRLAQTSPILRTGGGVIVRLMARCRSRVAFRSATVAMSIMGSRCDASRPKPT